MSLRIQNGSSSKKMSYTSSKRSKMKDLKNPSSTWAAIRTITRTIASSTKAFSEKFQPSKK